MPIKLKSIEFKAKATDGWKTDKLPFGDFYTVVTGPNGSGKSLLLRGVAFALGNALLPYKGVVSYCETIDLEIEIEGESYLLSRKTNETFNLTVFSESKSILFTTEAEFSRWLLVEQLGYLDCRYTDRRNSPIALFVSTIVPQIYINQDNGWNQTYWYPQPSELILNQEEEMLRATFGLTAKHEFGLREDESEIRAQIATIRSKKTRAKKKIEVLENELGSHVHLDLTTVLARRDEICLQLDQMNDGLGQMTEATRVYDEAIARKDRSLRLLQDKEWELGRNRQRLGQTIEGLSEETVILDHNQTAVACFRNYCDNIECGLFVDEKFSFGRRLLFLKDQIKDLEFSRSAIEAELAEISGILEIERRDLARLLTERDAALKAPEHERLSRSLRELTSQFLDVDRLGKTLSEHATAKAKYSELDCAERQLHNKVEEKKSRRKSDGSIKVYQDLFSNYLSKWIGILGTKNVPKTINVDSNFKMVLNDEIFSSKSEQSGSTRFRIVFSYHLAALQTSMELGGPHPRVLIFDSLRQHETDLRDIKNAFSELETLYKSQGKFQIILSARSSPVSLEADRDIIWEPRFRYNSKPYHLQRI